MSSQHEHISPEGTTFDQFGLILAGLTTLSIEQLVVLRQAADGLLLAQGVNLHTTTPVVSAPMAPALKQEKSSAQKPPRGESGSGWTRTRKGKLVKNRRPRQRPLVERQSRNAIKSARQALIDHVKSMGVERDSPPGPNLDPVYYDRLASLDEAKAYRAYVRETDSPKKIWEWRQMEPFAKFLGQYLDEVTVNTVLGEEIPVSDYKSGLFQSLENSPVHSD